MMREKPARPRRGGQGLERPCRGWEPDVVADVHGELPGREVALLRRHLAACPSCRAFRLEVARALRLLARIPRITPRRNFTAFLETGAAVP